MCLLALTIVSCGPSDEPLPVQEDALPPPTLATLTPLAGEALPTASPPRVELLSAGANVVDAQSARHRISLPHSAPEARMWPMLEFALPAATVDGRVLLAVDTAVPFERAHAIMMSIWGHGELDLAAREGAREVALKLDAHELRGNRPRGIGTEILVVVSATSVIVGSPSGYMLPGCQDKSEAPVPALAEPETLEELGPCMARVHEEFPRIQHAHLLVAPDVTFGRALAVAHMVRDQPGAEYRSLEFGLSDGTALDPRPPLIADDRDRRLIEFLQQRDPPAVGTRLDEVSRLDHSDHTFDRALLVRALRGRVGALNRCSTASPEHEPGEVQTSVTIDEQGHVSNTEITSNTTGDARLGSCVQGTMRRLRWSSRDAPSGEVTFAVTIAL